MQFQLIEIFVLTVRIGFVKQRVRFFDTTTKNCWDTSMTFSCEYLGKLNIQIKMAVFNPMFNF